MNRCGTCRFWGSDPGDLKGVYRQCRAVIHDERAACDHEYDDGVFNPDWQDRPDTFDEMRKKKAVAVDGSGYFAALRCREDFGCVLHQPKDGDVSAAS